MNLIIYVIGLSWLIETRNIVSIIKCSYLENYLKELYPIKEEKYHQTLESALRKK